MLGSGQSPQRTCLFLTREDPGVWVGYKWGSLTFHGMCRSFLVEWLWEPGYLPDHLLLL